MARLFDDASTEYLEINQAVLSGSMPLAFVCLFRPDDTIHIMLLTMADKDADDQRMALAMHDFANDNKILAQRKDGGGTKSALSTSGCSVDTWHHAAALFVSATDSRAYVDGGSKGINTDDSTPFNLDRTSIGRLGLATPGTYASGDIAEVAIYDLSKWPGASDSDKADNFEKILPSLAKGFTPDNFPLGLAAYWPLIRNLNDVVGGYNLTANGTVVAAHPRIIQPCGVL